MSTYITISPFPNSHYYSEADNNGINTLNQADFAHQIQPFQNGAGNPATMYFAKAVTSDTVTLLFHTQYNGIGDTHFPLLYVCGVHQNIIGAINLNANPVFKGRQLITGNNWIDPFSGSIYPLLSSMWSFTWSTFIASLTPGSIYYIRFDNLDNTGAIKTYFSEPIMLQASQLDNYGWETGWRNTLWFSAQYAANRMQNTNVIVSGWWNDYGTFLDPFNPVFGTRCEGKILDADMKMINIVYLMQNYEANFITGQQVAYKILEIGALSRGIPHYMLQMISEYLIADRLFVNSTGNSNLAPALAQWYKLAGGGNSTTPADLWKTKRDDCTPLLYGSVPLMLGSIAQQAMVTPYVMPYGRVIDYTGDITGA